MATIINKETLKKMNQGKATTIRLYKGDARQNAVSEKYEVRPIKILNAEGKIEELRSLAVKHNGDYVGSEGHARLWNEIEELRAKYNAAQGPAQDVLDALLGKMFIDITRRVQEAGDLTSLICTEINDPESAEVVNVRWLYKYVGKMGEVAGSNDSVNLIEQKTGATDSFSLKIKAIGWKDSLANVLYNKLHEMEKVNQAGADAYVDQRNAQTIGTIVGTTFVASQKQAADATAGATRDVKVYNTLTAAYKKLKGLKDPQTNRPIVTPRISLLVNSADSWDINRVIAGQLNGSNGTIAVQNMASLPIDNIIEYDRGITDGETYGKDTLSFPGVTAGKCYMFVPREYSWVINKRGLTMQTGPGETLQLSTQEKAWYAVDGAYLKDMLGSSYPGTTLGAGFGAIIEITLPA